MPSDDLTLLDGVAEVAEIASPNSPRTVTQRAFDEARSRSLFYPGMPRAKRIAERLKMTWPDVLATAHAHDDERGRLHANKTQPPPAKWVTRENAASALAVVAHRLSTDSLTQDEYDRERARMVAADAKRWMHGRQLRLPTHEQVTRAHGSWDAAVRGAGLQPQPATGKTTGKAWTRTDCVNAVARYLGDAARPSATGYRDWAAKQAGKTPTLGAIRRFGGWPVVSREASDRLLERKLGINAQ